MADVLRAREGVPHCPAGEPRRPRREVFAGVTRLETEAGCRDVKESDPRRLQDATQVSASPAGVASSLAARDRPGLPGPAASGSSSGSTPPMRHAGWWSSFMAKASPSSGTSCGRGFAASARRVPLRLDGPAALRAIPARAVRRELRTAPCSLPPGSAARRVDRRGRRIAARDFVRSGRRVRHRPELRPPADLPGGAGPVPVQEGPGRRVRVPRSWPPTSAGWTSHRRKARFSNPTRWCGPSSATCSWAGTAPCS